MPLLLHYLNQPDENTTNHGEVIFDNPNEKSLGWVEAEINKLLIGGDFFVPNRVGIPPLDGSVLPNEGDNTQVTDSDYHEPDAFEITDAKPTDPRTIEEFIADLAKYKKLNPLEFW